MISETQPQEITNPLNYEKLADDKIFKTIYERIELLKYHGGYGLTIKYIRDSRIINNVNESNIFQMANYVIRHKNEFETLGYTIKHFNDDNKYDSLKIIWDFW